MIMNHEIITEKKEVRLDKSNQFTLTLTGYHVFPMNELLVIRRSKGESVVGNGRVEVVTWANEQTTLTYSLTKLHGVN